MRAISGKLRTYVTLVVTGAVGLLALQFAGKPEIDWGAFAFFLVLILVAEALPVHIGPVNMTVTFMITMVAIIQLVPAAVTLVSAIGLVGNAIARRRAPLHRHIFNGAQNGLAAGLAAETYRLLGGISIIDAGNLGTVIPATLAATAIYFFVNTLAVSGALALASHNPFIRTWRGHFGWLPLTYIAFGGFGIVLASLYQFVNLLAVPLLLVPLMVARAVFRSYREVEEAYESTIKAFVSAIEAKDVYTRGHSERVTEYALLITGHLGMNEDEQRIFRYGALLHDVGKLAVKSSILTKPSGLSDEEFDEIKRHPVLGAQIVREIEFLRPALDGVLSHHERLDGSGYPAGLAGELVSKEARIMAVADSFDAMTSTRAYRGARTPEEAIAELRRCSGTYFDARLVELFVRAIQQDGAFQEIKARVESEAAAAPSVTG